MDAASISSGEERPGDRFNEVIALDGQLVNPFRGKNHGEMLDMIKKFLNETALEAHDGLFRKAAFLAQSPNAFATQNRPDSLTLDPEERKILYEEGSTQSRWTKWRQTPTLYAMIVCCSIGAAVQGWDETAVNAAQLWWIEDLKIPNDPQKHNDITGLLNSAPYLCCAVLGCWLTDPINRYFGRRGAIWFSCFVSCVTCIWQAFTKSWQHMFVARFFLGVGIGIKSATVPIYSSECAPKAIRGALTMQWQMWTAFGIMCGYVSGVIFSKTRNWQLVIGSPCIFPVIVMAYVYTLPESPRWLLQAARRSKDQKKRQKIFQKAWRSFERLRRSRLQAARDMFLVYHMLENEEKIRSQHNRFAELFTNPRNRRAVVASTICLFFQQFCGVNIFPYYSSRIFSDTNNNGKEEYSTQVTLLSLGFGIINFFCAIPAIPLIDSFGRRLLLLTTFPFMAAFQLMIGLAYTAENPVTRKALVTTGMYLFSVAYSPGEGPVPFVYGSESMPLYCRDLGMSLVTAINWFFNFLLSFTFPRFLAVFGHTGAFAYYAAWCVVGFFLILLYVPETRNQTLEELDMTFSVPSRTHAMYGLRQLRWFVLRYVCMQKTAQKAILPVKIRNASSHTNGGEVNGDWEPRYVVFGKDDAFLDAPSGFGEKPGEVQMI